jgi:transposase
MTMTHAQLVARAKYGEVRDDNPAPKPKRRRFSEEEKIAFLDEYDQLTEPGSKGAFLRKNGLFTSQIFEWRRLREMGSKGDKPSKRSSQLQRENERLRARNARLQDKLEKHQKALVIQGKASELLAKLLAEGKDQTEQQQ